MKKLTNKIKRHIRILKNKLSLKKRDSKKTTNKQRAVVGGLALILLTSFLAYMFILNPNFYTKEYSEPFRDWLFSYQGRTYLLLYFSVILLLIVASSSKIKDFIKSTAHPLGKSISKRKPSRIRVPITLRLPYLNKVKAKLVFRYSPAQNNKRKKRLMVLAWVVIILTPLVVFSLTNEKEVRAWWNDYWQYRQTATITNSGTSVSNFQVEIELSNSAGKMRSDCADIRVVDASQNLITDPYWVECGGSSSVTWVTVKLSTIPAGDTKIHVYYGNQREGEDLSSAGEDVFDFFDGFDGTSLDTNKWTALDATGVTVGDGVLKATSTSGWIESDTDFDKADEPIIEARWQHVTMASNGYSPLSTWLSTSNTWGGLYHPGSSILTYYRNDGAWTSLVHTNVADTKIRLVAHSDSTADIYYYNAATGATITSATGVSNSVDSEPIRFIRREDNAYTGQGMDARWDWIRSRKYDADISVADGSEESAPYPVAHWKFDEGYSETLEQPLTANEHQINIVTQVYSHTSTSNYPTDNSLGRVHWDADRFPGATVYFEAMIRNTGTAGYYQSWASLYSTSGSQVSGSEVTMGNRVGGTAYQYLRSGAITLTDDTDYTVRMRRQDGTGVEIKAARIIVVQNDSDGITDTETQIELGATEKQASSTYAQLTDKKIYYYDSTKFTPAPTTYFEATLRNSQPTIEQQLNIVTQVYSHTSTSNYPTDNSLGLVHWDADRFPGATVYFEAVIRSTGTGGYYQSWASLYSSSGSQVSGSEVTLCNRCGGSAYFYSRSGAITLTDDTDYTVRMRRQDGTGVEIKAARIVVIQTDATKITDTQTQIEVGATEKQSSSTYTQLTDKKIYYYDSSKFTPAPTTYFEATLRNSQPTIEQQLNIVNQVYYHTSTSNFPTDNSLGLVHWDADRFPGATVYFEAVIRSTGTGGYYQSWASLYSSGGSQVSGSEVTLCNRCGGSAYFYSRSGAITLTDDTDYTVRMRRQDGTGVEIKAARIVVIQTDATKITDTQAQVEVGATEKQASSTYTQLTDKKIYYYDSSVFTPAPTTYFEATMRNSQPTVEQQLNIIDQEFYTTSTSDVPTDNSLGLIHWDEDKYSGSVSVYFEAVIRPTTGDGYDRVYASLYSAAGSKVSGSEVQTPTNGNNTSFQYYRSGAITLTDDTDYTARIRRIDTVGGRIKAARLVVIQTDATKITDTQAQIEVGDYQTAFTNETYSTLTDPKMYMYDDDVFSPSPEASFSASLKIDDSGDTVYAELYNQTNSTVVGEVSHTGDTNWTLVTVNNIDADADWDTTNDDEYVVRIRCNDDNTGGCSGNIANAKITLDQYAAGGITDLETVQQQINTSDTDADTTYSNTDYIGRYNLDLETNMRSFAGGTVAYYYESTMKTSAGTGYAQLYNRTNSYAISSSEVTTTSTTYDRVRSSDITSNLPQYPQDYPQKQMDTQLKNSATNTTTASGSSVVIQVSNLATSGVTAYADLYNLTDTAVVSGSEVTTTSTSWARVRSSSITLTTGKEYVVRLHTSNNGAPIHMINAKIVHDQTAAGGITALETVQQQINAVDYDGDATYSNTDYINWYNLDLETSRRSFAGGTVNYFYEATLKAASTTTAYARLYNRTNSSVISSSEVTTTSTTYDRARSSDITSNLPQYPQDYPPKQMDTQLKNSTTNTTTASSSWIVVQVSGLATAGVTAYADLYNLTDSTVVSGSEVSTTSTSWTRVRSSSITLTTDKEYVVRTRTTNNGAPIHMTNAKIIHDQTAAGGITDLETIQQQINAVDVDADATYSNTDYINWYNLDLQTYMRSFAGGTVNYFYESTLKTSAGTGYARLYNRTNSSVISNSEVTTTSTTYDRVRSADITSNLPQYPQDYPAKQMDTQLKNSATNTTTASSSWMVVQVSDLATSGVTAYADLYNLTDSTVVSGSEVTTTTTAWTRVRSNSITLTTDKEYVVRTRTTNNGAPMHLTNAKIIHYQSDSDGIKTLETVQQQVNAITTDSDTGYSDKDYINRYTPGNHNVVANFNSGDMYYESTMKTSAGTGYSRLKNDSDGTTISGSEVTTTNTDYERVRSSSLSLTLPSANKNMDTQIKNSATNTTSVSSSWLIIQNSNTISAVTKDSTNNYHLGSIKGPTWNNEDDCLMVNCLNYDGSNDYVAFQDENDIDFDSSESFTISAWFKRADTANTNAIISKYYSPSGSGGYKVYMNGDGTITAGIDDDTSGFPEDSATSSSSYDDNKWHNVVAVKDGTSTLKLYVDGYLVGTDAAISATGNLTNADSLYVGIDGDGASNPFEGRIDEVKIYAYARSADEIKTDAIRGAAPSGSSGVLGRKTQELLAEDLAIHWKFDEAAANTCDDTNDACDSSGYLNHARWEDNASSVTGKFTNAVDFDGTNDRVATSSANGVPGILAWWNGSWSERKPITITNNEAFELTDYQIKMTVGYEGDMQPDFDDIRFVTSSGTELDYWMEEYTASSNALMWVEVDSLTASTETIIYMYYGNPGVSTTSNGDDTFVFFDDFESYANVSEMESAGWVDIHYSEADMQFTTTGGYGGTKAMQLWYNNGTGWDKSEAYWSGAQFSKGVALVMKYKKASDNFYTGVIGFNNDVSVSAGCDSDQGSNTVAIDGNCDSSNDVFITKSGGTGGESDVDFDRSSQWHSVEIAWNDSSKFTLNDVVKATRTTNIPSGPLYLHFSNFPQGTETTHYSWFDNVAIRKYEDNEPTVDIGLSEGELPQFSTSAWVNADTLGATNRVILARNNSGSYEWAIYNDSANPGKLKFTPDGETTTGLSDTTLSTSNWYHITMTVDGYSTKLYINGVLDKEITSSGTLASNGDISVGADPDGTDGWDGKIDDVRIYKKALPAKDVEMLYKWAPGPIAYYPLDENTGTTTVYDRSGNDYQGTMNGSMTEEDWIQGRIGSGLELDGSNDFIEASHDSGMNFGTGDFTASAWIKTDTTARDAIISKMTTNDGWYVDVLSTGYVRVAIEDGASTNRFRDSATTINDNTWHHIAVQFDGTADQLHLYVDGVLSEGTQTNNGDAQNTDSAESLKIGKNLGGAYGDYFDGQIDEVYIYNYARTPEQVTEDMNAGHPAPGSPIGSPTIYLKFDEGYGDSANDSSPQGNDGDLGGSGQTCPASGTVPCPLWTNEGRVDKALSYDGTDDYTTLPSLSQLSDYTISLWFKLDSEWNSGSSGQMMIYEAEGTDPDNYLYFDSAESGKLKFRNWTPTNTLLTTTDTWSADQWYHVVISHDSSTTTKSIYVDGKLENSTTVSGLYLNTNSYHELGSYQTSSMFLDGNIDEFKLYDFALNSTQVKTEYNQGKPVVYGATSTDSSGVASNSGDRAYCPPGDSTSSCAPIAEWKLDEGTGSSTYDTSANNNTGTISESLWVKGIDAGWAQEFDGSDDYIDVGTNSSMDVAGGDYTISAWAKWTATTGNGRAIVEIGSFTNNYALTTGFGAAGQDKVGFAYGSNTWKHNVGSGLNDGQWHYIVGVMDSGTPYVYIDGVSHGLNNLTYTFTTNNRIGEGGQDNFGGQIDLVRIYDYARTQEQVAWDYNYGKPIGWWKFDECTNTTAYDSGTAGNNGTITEPGSGTNDAGVGNCDTGNGDEMWDNGTTGKLNSSLDFDGTDDYMTTSAVDIIAEHNTNTKYVSYGAWVNPATSPTSDAVIYKNNEFRLTTTASDQPQCELRTGGVWQTPAQATDALPTSTWSHVFCTYDGSDIKIYVNGELKDTEPETGNILSSNGTTLTVGRNPGDSQYFDGQIDDVRLYNYGLTSQQVKTVINTGAVRFGPATGSP